MKTLQAIVTVYFIIVETSSAHNGHNERNKVHRKNKNIFWPEQANQRKFKTTPTGETGKCTHLLFVRIGILRTRFIYECAHMKCNNSVRFSIELEHTAKRSFKCQIMHSAVRRRTHFQSKAFKNFDSY